MPAIRNGITDNKRPTRRTGMPKILRIPSRMYINKRTMGFRLNFRWMKNGDRRGRIPKSRARIRFVGPPHKRFWQNDRILTKKGDRRYGVKGNSFGHPVKENKRSGLQNPRR